MIGFVLLCVTLSKEVIFHTPQSNQREQTGTCQAHHQ